MVAHPHTFPWPKKGAKLFVEGGNYYEFAHIGWGSLHDQFNAYATGYKASADTLIESAIRSKSIAILDTTFYPVAFMYRQFLELVMKSIFIRYSPKSKTDKITVIKDNGHSLLKIWEEIKPIISEHATKSELADIKVVQDYITQFHQLDASSMTFRYPIDKKLQQALGKQSRINLVNLRDRMNDLDAFFDGCTSALAEIAGWKSEEFESLLSDIF